MDIPCFVVSLKRATERRAHLVREFGREGIVFEYIDAIDGGTFTPDDVRRFSRRKYAPAFGLPMTPGDIACTASHGLAMQAIIDRGIDRAIIFEDDATLSPGFAKAVERLLSVHLRWDVLKLSGAPLSDFNVVAEIGPQQIVRPPLASILAQGYVITAAGAKKLRPFTTPAADLFDFVLQSAWSTGVELYEVQPRLVGSRGLPSTINYRADYQIQPTFIGRWQRRAWKWRRSLWSRRQWVGM